MQRSFTIRMAVVAMACILFLAISLTSQRTVRHNKPAPVASVAAQTQASRAKEIVERRKVQRRSFENFPLNVRLFQQINRHHTPILDRVFLLYSYFGMGQVLIPVLVFVFFWRRRLLYPLLLAVAIETVLVIVLKGYYDQPRPATFFGDEQVHLLINLHRNSFPSGDAAIAFTIAAIMQFGERWWIKGIWFLYAALIAYERIYVGVHFPLDVVAGCAIGIASATLALVILRKQLRPWATESDDTAIISR